MTSWVIRVSEQAVGGLSLIPSLLSGTKVGGARGGRLGIGGGQSSIGVTTCRGTAAGETGHLGGGGEGRDNLRGLRSRGTVVGSRPV